MVLSAVAASSVVPAATQVTPLLAGGGFIELAILFVILAIVAAVLGARGVAGLSMTIAKWLILVFLVLAVVSFLL